MIPEILMEHPEGGLTRRRFLGKAALGCAAGAGGLAGIAALRSIIPALTRTKKVFSVGHLPDFPVNTFTLLPEHKVFILRDHEGVRAVSAVCTHLGCVLKRVEDEFRCPCHGSRFANSGEVMSGPAPSALPWFKLDLAPDGQIRVHTNQRTTPQDRLRLF
ncbi:MAG: Rieske 2Fe-2S domain-containing protein [Candidatus Aminicenantaceae bacterium]